MTSADEVWHCAVLYGAGITAGAFLPKRAIERYLLSGEDRKIENQGFITSNNCVAVTDKGVITDKEVILLFVLFNTSYQ